MSFALSTLWHERQRFLPGILAVAFSALLIALQCGLLLGLFAVTSLPIDRSRAHIWISAPDVPSVDLGRPISDRHLALVASIPEVERTEVYMQAFTYWAKPHGGSELCMVVGSRLGPDALGAIAELTPELRARLTEPGAVVVDESELSRLGISGVGDTAEIIGHRVRVVGLLKGVKSVAGPYVFCSIRTAEPLVRMAPDGGQTTYVLATCHEPEDAAAVVARLRRTQKLSAYTAAEFSRRSRLHWLTKTKAGIALGYTAVLGLLVGAVVTYQTLYAATVASLRELAVLSALGIPRWRMATAVLAQSFWVGVVGIGFALPAVFSLGQLAETLGVHVDLRAWILGLTGGVTLLMAMLSGLIALRSLRLVEPATLLR
jgi:putative ABC transport system permease protein